MTGKRGSADPAKAMAVRFNPNTRFPFKQYCLWILEIAGIEACAEFCLAAPVVAEPGDGTEEDRLSR